MTASEFCYRCGGELELLLPDSPAISFLRCSGCGSEYAREPGQALHDRWLMPLTMPLYELIFVKDPVAEAPDLAHRFATIRDRIDLEELVEHIDDELARPKQKLVETLSFVHATETDLRASLARFREELPGAIAAAERLDSVPNGWKRLRLPPDLWFRLRGEA